MVEDLCDEHIVEMNSDDNVDQIEQEKEGESSAAAPTATAVRQVALHFCSLEDIAEQCDITETSYYLRKAKLAWMSAHGSRATKQTCVRDYL